MTAQRERIMRNLEFNPGSTAAEIAAVLRLPVAGVRAELVAMQRSGMVQRSRANAGEPYRWCDCISSPLAEEGTLWAP